ncbi:MAG TPA: magnesium transporter [Dehalococcoidia bacterium]|nr:magnesium transporter [Dehalococcoidia bacterium]
MDEATGALSSDVRDLLDADNVPDAAARLEAVHPADAAEIFLDLGRDERARLLPAIDREALARVIEYLADDARADLIADLPPAEVAPILDEIDDDIVVDILHQLPTERAEQFLREMRRAAFVAPLLRHADETAGGHMTRAFIALQGNWTVDHAIQYLRRVRPEADSAYYLYVVDPANRLEGIVSLRDLIIARPEQRLDDIMSRDIIKARSEMDQEEVARLVSRYDLVALPVVDEEDRLVGVITVDDVLDVIEEEATEDILKVAGIGVDETALSPVLDSARRRLPWLVVNMFTAFLAAFVVSRFEHTISEVAALAAFMPIIAGQGGNAGIQTSTIVLRGLALAEIDLGDLARVLRKEIALGLLKGVIFGAMLAVVAYIWQDNATFAFVAGAAMLLNMLVASVGGVMIPITLRYVLRVDPATAAGVFDTTLTDIMGFFIFLGLATLLLNNLT